MGVIAVIKNPNSVVNRLFCIFSTTLSLWSACSFFENLFYNFKLSLFFLNLDFFLGVFVFFFSFLFLFNFPEENKKINNYVLLFFIPTLINVYLLMSGKIITNITSLSGRAVFQLGDWFWFYALTGALSIFSGIIFQFVQYKKSFGIKKEQIKYIIFGALICSIIILVFNLLLQNRISGNIIMFANFSVVIWIFCIFYAIVRYHLMDIKIILRLGTVFTFLLAVIIFIYMIANYFLIRFFGVDGFWAYAIPSFVITISFTHLKKIMETVTDKIFFSKEYKFSEVIGEIESSIHRAGLDLDKTLEIVNRTITSALQVKSGAILILIPKDSFISRQIIGENISELKFGHNHPIINYLNLCNKILLREDLERFEDCCNLSETSRRLIIKEMDKRGLALVAPIKFKNKLIGVYLLGEKKSYNYFTQEDIDLLRHVAWEMSFAIDNAKSYEELRHLDEAKSNFISVASHQLRTPVTISRCNLELCFDPKITTKEKDLAMNSAYDGIVSLGRQLDQLLTVLEIEERGIFVKKQVNKISTMISEVICDNKISIKNKKIKVAVNINNDLLMANCDRSKIKNILNVLLVNAISYNFIGGHVDIAVEKSSFNGKKKIIFSVADNGIGISESSKSEIFKKFFRSQEAILTLPNGFGLGLFISKKIINAHGGDIWFENKDHGVVFYFSLPA